MYRNNVVVLLFNFKIYTNKQQGKINEDKKKLENRKGPLLYYVVNATAVHR